MSNTNKMIISASLGFFMGFILPKIAFYSFFTTSGLAMIPWGLVGVGLCLFAENLKQSTRMGQSYLVVVAESFLFLGHLKFNKEVILALVFLGIVFIVAMICGYIIGFVSYYLKRFAKSILL